MNLKLTEDPAQQKEIINAFYKGLSDESIHDAVTCLEERKKGLFSHGEVYFKNDLTTEEQETLKLDKSEGLFILNMDEEPIGTITSLQLIVQYLVANRETIVAEKNLSHIQLENIIDRLELTLKSEHL